jgi:hypothetical protein
VLELGLAVIDAARPSFTCDRSAAAGCGDEGCGGSFGQASVASDLLPGGDLRADAVEAAQDGIDGVIAEWQP